MAEKKKKKEKLSKQQKLTLKQIKKQPLFFEQQPINFDALNFKNIRFYELCYDEFVKALSKLKKQFGSEAIDEKIKAAGKKIDEVEKYLLDYELAKLNSERKKNPLKTLKEHAQKDLERDLRKQILLTKETYLQIMEEIKKDPMRFADVVVDFADAQLTKMNKYENCYFLALDTLKEKRENELKKQLKTDDLDKKLKSLTKSEEEIVNKIYDEIKEKKDYISHCNDMVNAQLDRLSVEESKKYEDLMKKVQMSLENGMLPSPDMMEEIFKIDHPFDEEFEAIKSPYERQYKSTENAKKNNGIEKE